MFRINLLSVIGGAMVLMGLLGPWLSFSVAVKYDGSASINAMVHTSMSPFTLTLNLTSTSSKSIYEDVEVLESMSASFYSLRSSLVGVACILGAILGPVGEKTNRWKLTLAAGLLALLSTLVFILFLPTIFIRQTLSMMWGFWFSILGSILIISSIGFRVLVLKWEYTERF